MTLEEFYVRQLRLLDDGAVEEWADTFTAGAVFTQHAPAGRTFAGGAPAVRSGRVAIAAALRAAVAKRAGSRVTRRYWLGMLRADGAGRTRWLAFNIETPVGGRPVLHNSTGGEDLLVPAGDSWRVHRRTVVHDAAAPPTAG
ncbi:nuclear transport factor 2 family protein [Dactylosporangium sp. NPDC048998]|uniref:nuclear transport factor 2 family protein n=1 Tax=Dactylosporangium sp. NPDC048998 TaxID=3363976 RepID=UPI00371F7832